MTNLDGFSPMLFEPSEQAKFMVPMNLALTFWLLFGMAATLLLIPTCYAVLEDIKEVAKKGLSLLKKYASLTFIFMNR